MLQEPQGSAGGTAGAPQVQEPQQPQGPFTTPAVPPYVHGPDSPPAAIGLPQEGSAAPPPLQPFEFPLQPPSDPAEFEQFLLRFQQQLNLIAAHQDQGDLASVYQNMEVAPRLADSIAAQMRVDPDARDYGAEISDLEPFLPPTKARELKDSHRRITEGRQFFDQFSKAYEERLRTDFPQHMHTDKTRKYEALQQQLKDEIERVNMGKEQRKTAGTDNAYSKPTDDYYTSNRMAWDSDPMQSPRAKELRAKMDELRPQLPKQEFGAQDWMAALSSPFTSAPTVRDSMMRLRDEVTQDVALSTFPGLKKFEKGASFNLVDDETGARIESALPHGWTYDTVRALAADASRGVIDRVKRDTEMLDIGRETASVAAWAPIGVGELKAAQYASKALKLIPWMAKAPRLLKAGEAFITYMGGPAALEGTYGFVRPLPPDTQAEIDSIEDHEQRQTKETAHRILQSTEDAALATLFSFSDVAKGFRASRGLHVPLESPGRMVWDAVRFGLLAPPAIEGVDAAAGKLAEQYADHSGGVADVLSDIHAARKDFGVVSRYLNAKNGDERVDALMDWMKQAAPMAMGIGAAHVLAATGTKLDSRQQGMRLMRQARHDMLMLEEKGIPPEVVKDVGSSVYAKLEAAMPTKAEDQRAQNRAKVVDNLGEQGNAHVMVEQASDEVLPDVPGATIDDKIAQLEAESAAMPDDPRLRAKLLAARRIRAARAAGSAAEVDLLVSRAERDLVPPELAPEVETEPLGADADRRALERNLALEENPAAADAATARVADQQDVTWHVVGRDEEAKTLTLRDAANPSRRIRVGYQDLPAYKLEQSPLRARGEVEADLKALDTEEATANQAFSDATKLKLTEQWPDMAQAPGNLRKSSKWRKLYQGEQQALAGREKQVQELADRRGALTEDLRRADEAAAAPVVDDLFETAKSTVAKGITSARQLAKALGVGEARARRIQGQLVEHGVLVAPTARGKGYTLAQAAEQPSMKLVTETEQTERDLNQTAVELARHVEAMGRDPEHGPANARVIGNLLADYADLQASSPDEASRIQEAMGAAMLRSLPESMRTPETVTGVLGLAKTQVESVLAQVDAPRAPELAEHAAIAGDSMLKVGRRTMPAAEAYAKLTVDRVRAAKAPDLAGLEPSVRSTYETRLAAGATEEEAARAAFDEWSKQEGMLLTGYDRYVNLNERAIDAHHRDILSRNPAQMDEGLGGLADYIRSLDGADDTLSLLSMTERGRAVLQRVNDLFEQIVVKREVTKLPPLNKREGESGHTLNGTPLDWSLRGVLISAKKAAGFLYRLLKWSIGQSFRATMRTMKGITGLLAAVKDGAVGTAVRLARRQVRSRVDRVAAGIRRSAESATSKNAKRRSGRSLAASVYDKGSLFGELTLAEQYEHNAHMARIAQRAGDLFHQVFREGSEQDNAIHWLTLNGVADATRKEIPEYQKLWDELNSIMTPEQLQVLDATSEMLEDLRTLTAQEGLPHQLARRMNLDMMQLVIREQSAAVAAAEKEVQAAQALRAEAKAAAKGKLKEDPDYIAAQKQVAKAQRKANAMRKKADRYLQRYNQESDAHRKDVASWGVTNEGYAPATPNVDPNALKDAMRRGGMFDKEALDAAIAGTRESEEWFQQLATWAKDMTWSPLPKFLTAGHWTARKEVLEDNGLRDMSITRSMFHYLREVYRTIGANQWLYRNFNRLAGQPYPVSVEEMRQGKLHDGTRTIELWGDGSPQRVRLGGAVYELRLVGDKGQQKSLHFQSLAELKKARAADPMDLAGYGEGKITWQFAEKQDYQRKVLLLPPKETAAIPSTNAAAYGATTSAADGVGGHVEFDRMKVNTRFHQIVNESEIVGRAFGRHPGEFARVRAHGGPEALARYGEYIARSMQRMTVGEDYTVMQRAAGVVTSVIRHKQLGMANPFKAFKEIIETTLQNLWHMGAPRAFEAAALASDYTRRLTAATKSLEARPSDWLREHTMKMRDGKPAVFSDEIASNLRTPQSQLDKMKPERRAEQELIDEAFVEMYGSMFGSDTAIEQMMTGRRDFAYGEQLHYTGGIVPRSKDDLKAMKRTVTHALEKASFGMRQHAQGLSLASTWIGAYLNSRRAGASVHEARRTATHYSMSTGNLNNKLLQPEWTQSALGMLSKPLASWNMAVSASNFRFFFHHGWKESVKRLSHWAFAAWAIQQGGSVLDWDLSRWTSTGMSEIPAVGPMSTWSIKKLYSMLEMAADPADSEETLPQWRLDMQKWARENADGILAEYMQRVAGTIGGFPADTPVPMLWGTWKPVSIDTVTDWWAMADAAFKGDEKRTKELAYRNLIGNLWLTNMMNEIRGTKDDPADSNYALVLHPATGRTMDRIAKGDWMSVIYRQIGPGMERSQEIINKSVIEPLRDEMKAAAERSRANRIQQHLLDAKEFEDRAQTASPKDRDLLLQMAEKERNAFRDQLLDVAREKELTRNEARSLYNRWKKQAESNITLTQKDRDILNAYSTEDGFLRLANALNDVRVPMTEDRFRAIIGMWYSDGKTFRAAVRGLPTASRDRFLQAYESAQVRWAAERKAK